MQHEELSALVSDWLRGDLAPAQAETVAAHVAACAPCQASADAARALLHAREQSAAHATSHVGSDALAGYVVAAASEPIESLAVTGLHLKDCDECRSDAALMRAAAQVGWRRRLRVRLAGPRGGWAPALAPALAVLLLLAYPAWRGVTRDSRAHPRLAGGGVAALVLQDTPRAANELPSLHLREGQALQPFLLDAAPRGVHLTVTLVREPSTVVWTLTAPANEFWDVQNRVLGVMVPASALSAGDYRIELGDELAPIWFSARFRVVSPPRAEGD
jgi:hypothetical protein